MNLLTQLFNQVFSNRPYNTELIKQSNDPIAPIGGQNYRDCICTGVL